MSFTHLHVHTEYSLLDGVNRTAALFEKVKSLGMESVALTDHGVMYGSPEFWKYSKDFGIKPIMGCEIYLAPKERNLKEVVDGVKYYHLVLLAKNITGFRNLTQLVTIGHLEGMYYKPRVDKETLRKYSEGIICTSACLAGPIARNILKGREEQAIEWLEFLKDVFKDDFYLELQRNGFSGSDDVNTNSSSMLSQTDEESIDNVFAQATVNKKLREFSVRFKVPLVATTDAHYLNAEDKEIQTMLFAIKDGRTLDDPGCRLGYEGTYIKSTEEMYAAFSDDKTPVENTMIINEKIESFNIGFDRVQPRFWNIPEGKSAEFLLREFVYEGAIKKYPSKETLEKDQNNVYNKLFFVQALPETIRVPELMGPNELSAREILHPKLIDRLNYEMEVIHNKGFDDYFLVVSDLMKWSASSTILMGVRGSAAGSAAAHCLDIVEVEPIKWELYFERFLNPERPSPPDIDMDIQDSRRDEVINYVKDKYGHDSVAAICTLGRLKTKAAIRDISRAMGIDLKVADRLSKMVTVLFGKPFKITQMMETNPEFANLINSSEDLQKMAKVVKKITDMSRHMSVHACGYLITPGPIVDYVPLQYESGGDNRVITQYEGPWLEELGLMKFDFLGLRTLTIVSNCIRYVKENQGIDINYFEIKDGDQKTYEEIFGKGETTGVFQFESPPMRQYLKDLRASNQEDLCFMVAAYRPGAMKYIPDYIKIKHGQKSPEYLVPELEPIMGATYGFAIYQEQAIRIAVDLAGYTMGQSDVLRRAIGKKKVEVMKKEEELFLTKIVEKGFDNDTGQKLWNVLLPFADYGFNKAHAAGYAVLAYKSAYLKANYPLEFMTALMHSDLQDFDRIGIDIEEARRMGFDVLPPSINASQVDFVPEQGKAIRFGLGAIKNVGVKICEAIVEEREINGLYESLDDFIYRLKDHKLTKKVVECLVMSGAMDEFGDRNALIAIIPQVYEKTNQKSKAVNADQTDLFSMFATEETELKVKITKTPFPMFTPASKNEMMRWEKDLLGVFISVHPLDQYRWVRLNPEFVEPHEIEGLQPGKNVKMVCMFSMIKTTYTKKDNSKMAIVTIEGYNGKIDGVLFPRAYEQYKHLVEDSKPLIIQATVNEREEKKSLIINEIDTAASMMKPNKVTVDILGIEDRDKLAELKEILKNSGNLEVEILFGTKQAPQKKSLFVDIEDKYVVEQLRQWT